MSISWKAAQLASAICLLAWAPATAQHTSAPGALTLQAVGTIDGGGEFKGTISITRFEQQGDGIVAVGFLSGVLSRRGDALGTAATGEIRVPVVVRSGGVSTARHDGPAGASSTRGAPARVQPASNVVPAQTESCPVLNITLGPHTVDLLGFQVALSPISLDVAGTPGTPLGELVCAASALLTNVARLVNVLNNILFLLIALLGGLAPLGGGALPIGLVAGMG